MPEAKTASSSTNTKSRTAPAKRPTAKRATAARRGSNTPASNTRVSNNASTRVRRAGAAERIVLVPLGAALIARERVLSGVNDVIDSYSSPSKANTQLRRFERRGATARKQLEREVRKTRVRVERELRHGRTRFEHELRRRRRLADRVQERISSLL